MSFDATPSVQQMYCSLYDAVQGCETPREGLLLAKLRPVLESRWRAKFDDGIWAYLTAEGIRVRPKKVKHLVQDILAWRQQQAPATALELVRAANRNDWMLRLCCEGDPVVDAARASEAIGVQCREATWRAQSEPAATVGRRCAEECAERASFRTMAKMRRQCAEETAELARLRAENASLRCCNEELQQLGEAMHAQQRGVPHSACAAEPLLCVREGSNDNVSLVQTSLMDDPFEPPPQASRSWEFAETNTTNVSTCSPSCGTPLSPGYTLQHEASSYAPSGAMTPMLMTGQACFLMPVWFQAIPSGSVQRMSSQLHSLPSVHLGTSARVPGIVERVGAQLPELPTVHLGTSACGIVVRVAAQLPELRSVHFGTSDYTASPPEP